MARPRYSIIPGDFATDARADVAHFRVLNHLGSHTDGDGWCRLKQVTIGDACGMTRETVNRKLRDLVEWGYVERHAEDATGRAIWYRVLMDRHRPQPVSAGDEPDASDDATLDMFSAHGSEAGGGPVSGGSHVEYNSSAELHPTCDRTDHTRCDRTQSQQERPSLNDQVKTPLPPQAGEQGLSDRDEGLLAQLRASFPHDMAVEGLIAPLLARRRFSATSPLAALEAAVRSIGKAGFTSAHIAKVLEIVLAADVKVVKAERLAAAIEAVRKGGLMLVIAKGTPEFAAWLRHFEKVSPNMAQLMAREGKWQVPKRFPDGALVPPSDSPAGSRAEGAGGGP